MKTGKGDDTGRVNIGGVLQIGKDFTVASGGAVDPTDEVSQFVQVSLGISVGGKVSFTSGAESVLSKLVIKGPLFGTVGGMDYFGILAGKIASATINGRAVPVAIGGQNLSVALSGDVVLKDAI